ncbi:MAG: hypothetical protein PHH91_02930 [Desulfuromonadaceae bacterium]|nr:hypothetical protein [Desulfuromonadaceae bacterium]
MPDEALKKHSCPDCRCCQWCSDDRCRLCLNQSVCRHRKRTMAEQIALYDSLNPPDSIIAKP